MFKILLRCVFVMSLGTSFAVFADHASNCHPKAKMACGCKEQASSKQRAKSASCGDDCKGKCSACGSK